MVLMFVWYTEVSCRNSDPVTYRGLDMTESMDGVHVIIYLLEWLEYISVTIYNCLQENL